MNTIAELPESPPEPSTMLERLAKNPEVDINKFERLVAMQREQIADQRRTAFMAAFAKMQAEIPVITKKGEIKVGDTIRSTYARFEDIDRVIKPVLHRHGFGLMHKQVKREKSIIITSTLMHQEGHSESTDFEAAADSSGSKNDIQAHGSTLSYGKRQNTKSLLNIAEGGEDDDGQTAGRAEPMSEEHQATAEAKCKEVGPKMLGIVLKSYQAKSLADIADAEYPVIISRLEATLKTKATA